MTEDKLKKLHDRFADVLVAWHAYDEANPEQKFFITNLIDHKTSLHFASDAEVRVALQELEAGFESAGNTEALVRVKSYLTFLDCAQNPQNYSISGYYAAMTGLELRAFRQSEINEIERNLQPYLDALGVSRLGAFDNLKALEVALSPHEFQDRQYDLLIADTPLVRDLTGLSVNIHGSIALANLALDTSMAQAGWENGAVAITFNKSRLDTRPVLNMDSVRHEFWGHGMHFFNLKDKVQNGELPKSAGILSTCGNELMHMEAMAESISGLFMNLSSPTHKLEQAYYWLSVINRMYEHNNAIAIIKSIDEGRNDKIPAGYIISGYKKHQMHIPLIYGPVCVSMRRLAHAIGTRGFGNFLHDALPAVHNAGSLNALIEKHAYGSQRYNLRAASAKPS